MKLLVVFHTPPLPPPLDLGATKRNLPFFLELAKYNEVSVLAFGTPEDERLFRGSYGGLCKEVRFVSRKRLRIFSALHLLWLFGTGRSTYPMTYRPAMQKAINEAASRVRFDLIHCTDKRMGFFKFPADVPVTCDTHDVRYDQMRRIAKNTRNLFQKLFLSLEWRFCKSEEFKLCRKFDLVTTTTERDLAVFKKDLPDVNMAAIPMGAGDNCFEDIGVKPEALTMVFTGLFSYLPNSDGILWFLDNVLPAILGMEPKARIYVVGKSPTRQMLARACDNVIVTGFVKDVRPYMARSQVFVIPILAGGGIRGKALDAMAMKRPIVTTTIGVEGIQLGHGESALFADKPEDFAKAVVRLFRDAELRQRLADNAFATAQRFYTWAATGKELDRLLRLVVAARAKKTNPDSGLTSGFAQSKAGWKFPLRNNESLPQFPEQR